MDVPNRSAPLPPSLRAYRALSALSGPAARLALRIRRGNGKEDAARHPERLGVASAPRPAGPLLWAHAASIGEALSLAPLLERVRSRHPRSGVLVTTGTVTSAQVLEKRLPEGVIHQYAPIDHPRCVAQFFGHWRPDVAVIVESELWPNLVLEAERRGAALVLLNARMSATSYARWRRAPASIARLLSAFSVIAAQDEQQAERLSALAGRTVAATGALKLAAAAPPADQTELARLHAAIGKRPVWLAASTHKGEEAAILDAARTLDPKTLTMIAPRHPERGAAVAAAARRAGFSVARRSEGDALTSDISVYVADTVGELGLFYRLAEVAFIGASLVEAGGHNPLEAARLARTIITGPHTHNFSKIYAGLHTAKAVVQVESAAALAAAVQMFLDDPDARAACGWAALTWSERAATGVLDGAMRLIEPLLDAAEARR